MVFSQLVDSIKTQRGTWLFVLLLAVLALQIYQIWQRPVTTQVTSAVPLASTTPVNIFSSQTASIRGKITKVNGTTLSITNDQNVSGDFEAGRVLLINDSTDLLVASSSADLQKLPLNRDAVINFLYTEGRYVVTSLTYR